MDMQDFGIGLTGGGARGSYQAGVLKALTEILREQNLTKENNPFQFWSGASAGSINAALMSSHSNDLASAADKLINLWEQIETDQVYNTDLHSLSLNSAKWIRDLTFGTMFKQKLAYSLLDTAPLWKLLEKNLPLERLDEQISRKFLKALACSAYSYKDNRTVTFCHGEKEYIWDRHRRQSVNVKLRTEHIMASCAIPLLFPPIKVASEYFADGNFRNLSPISPLIQMGAKKILMVSVKGREEFSERIYRKKPGLARISGLILNALFFDTIDIDLERVRHINEIVGAVNKNVETKRSDYSQIQYIVIRPSADIGKIASEKIKDFPRFIKFLIGGLGAVEESAELMSYILFIPAFTKELIALGYNDTLKQKKEIIKWLET